MVSMLGSLIRFLLLAALKSLLAPLDWSSSSYWLELGFTLLERTKNQAAMLFWPWLSLLQSGLVLLSSWLASFPRGLIRLALNFKTLENRVPRSLEMDSLPMILLLFTKRTSTQSMQPSVLFGLFSLVLQDMLLTSGTLTRIPAWNGGNCRLFRVKWVDLEPDWSTITNFQSLSSYPLFSLFLPK